MRFWLGVALVVPYVFAGLALGEDQLLGAAFAMPLVASSQAAAAGPLYSHHDCVGPGLPLTAGAHTTHTDTVSGFAFDGTSITFNLSTFALTGPGGICPTTISGTVLPDDFTGRWHMTAVCGPTAINAGAKALDWQIDAIAGAITSQASNGLPCFGLLNTPFTLDVTIEISKTNLPIVNLPIDPIGGVSLTITK